MGLGWPSTPSYYRYRYHTINYWTYWYKLILVHHFSFWFQGIIDGQCLNL